MTIYLDMDDVLCDWTGAALDLYGKRSLLDSWPAGETAVYRALGIREADFLDTINLQGAKFWAELKPTPWMEELLQLVATHAQGNWGIATNPGFDVFRWAMHGKVEWLNEHLMDRLCPPQSIFFGSKKYQLARSECSLLIDDMQSNCHLFEQAGGNAVLLPREWNCSYGEHKDPMQPVREFFLEHKYRSRA